MEPKRILISIIIPTFYEAEHIEKCLKSIQQQKFNRGKIEVIVVDSNSADNTKLIARKYTDRVLNIEDRGVSKARNIGAQKAKGRILLFLDADTILDSGFMDEMYESFADSDVVCVTGRVAGLERWGIIDNLFMFLHYGIMNKVSAITAYFGFPFFPTVCCACRKNVFHDKGGFDENLAIAEDLIFSLKMGKTGRCLVNKEAIAYTSARRIKKNGRLRNYYSYFRNYFKVFVLKEKPWTEDFPHTVEI